MFLDHHKSYESLGSHALVGVLFPPVEGGYGAMPILYAPSEDHREPVGTDLGQGKSLLRPFPPQTTEGGLMLPKDAP